MWIWSHKYQRKQGGLSKGEGRTDVEKCGGGGNQYRGLHKIRGEEPSANYNYRPDPQ